MTVSPVTSATTPTTTPAREVPTTQTGTTSLDYDNFLQLLVTQMKNQDPLSPMDDGEYIAQLATFSNVEQSIITNNKLDDLTTLSTIGNAQGLIGHTLQPPSGDAGVVKQITVKSDGAYAVFVDGRTVPLGEGLTIS